MEPDRDRFVVQYPHVFGNYAVLDTEHGSLVCNVESMGGAKRIARALNALLDGIDLHWFQPSVDELTMTERRVVIRHLANLLTREEANATS